MNASRCSAGLVARFLDSRSFRTSAASAFIGGVTLDPSFPHRPRIDIDLIAPVAGLHHRLDFVTKVAGDERAGHTLLKELHGEAMARRVQRVSRDPSGLARDDVRGARVIVSHAVNGRFFRVRHSRCALVIGVVFAFHGARCGMAVFPDPSLPGEIRFSGHSAESPRAPADRAGERMRGCNCLATAAPRKSTMPCREPAKVCGARV